MTISSTAPTIDATGIHVPAYSDILTYLQTQFQGIYGSDVYLGNDSQDGQFLGIIAQAIFDSNAAASAVYNAFSPATAQGNALSSAVKLNGLQRLVPTNSTVNVTLIGVAGTTISNGVVGDVNNNLYNLPSTVVIPVSGTITVTATAQALGAIAARIGQVTSIQTPTLGWQSVTNASAATPGNPVETDAALRVRQSNSVSLGSLTVLAGIVGAVLACPGVTQVVPYENDTSSVNALGIPANSFALVVVGGTSAQIGAAILLRKTPGTYTYGNTTVAVADSIGITHQISYSVPTAVPISVTVNLHALTGYTSAIGAEIVSALVAYIASLPIGQNVMCTRLYVPAQLAGSSDSLKYEIVSVLIAIKPNAVGSSDLTIAYNQIATLAASDVTITVM